MYALCRLVTFVFGRVILMDLYAVVLMDLMLCKEDLVQGKDISKNIDFVCNKNDVCQVYYII